MILRELRGDFITYFNWSANVLAPINPCAADKFLKENRDSIIKVAKKLMDWIGYVPGTAYRGIILRESVNAIVPHKNLEYLSFSTERRVAEYFADINGFGSDIVDVTAQLGWYGYVIEYKPVIDEILFHYDLLEILPYAEAFSLLGMKGHSEVEGLKKQKEIVILQPTVPFTNITRK